MGSAEESTVRDKPTGGCDPQVSRWLGPACGAALVLLVLLAFLPTLRAGFLNWDDNHNFVSNPHYRGIGPTSLQWMFTTFYAGHYQPLSWLTLGLDYLLWGMNPAGYHATNLLLHAAGVVIVLFLTRRLMQLAVPSAAAVDLTLAAVISAAVFAVHPLRVESVAWITERRDVLSGLFFFGTLLAYVRYAESRRADAFGESMVPGGWYSLTLLLYVLSLLSKAAGVGLPVVLLVLDAYPLRRLGGRVGWFTRPALGVWLEKVPILMAAVGFGVVALHAQEAAGALTSLNEYGVAERLSQAVYGLLFYLVKSFHPTQLGPIYEIADQPMMAHWALVIRIIVLIMITAVAYGYRKRVPALLAIWICYIVLVIPVVGIVQAGAQLVADRYSYLSCTGLAMLAGGAWLWVRRQRERRALSVVVGQLTDIGAFVLVAALMLMTYAQAAVWTDSLSLWQHAVAVSPSSSIAHGNLGDALIKTRQYEAAEAHFRRAIEINPRDAKAHNGLGVVLLNTGHPQASLDEFAAAVVLRPTYAHAWSNAGYVLRGLGRFSEAVAAYEKALSLSPGLPGARLHFANALIAVGRYGDADAALVDAIRLQPHDTELLANRAWLLATAPDDRVRDGEEAVELASRVCQAENYRDPYSLETLAAALAETGRYDHAVTTAEHARALAQSHGLSDLVATLNRHLDDYRGQRPIRMPPPAATQPVPIPSGLVPSAGTRSAETDRPSPG